MITMRVSPAFQACLPLLVGFAAYGDIVYPNGYEFEAPAYFLTRGDTNDPQVYVSFRPGHRDASGSVSYSTSDGTAIAGHDYEPASGVLTFGWPWTKPITIKVRPQPPDAPEKTIFLHLSVPAGAYSYRPGTVLHINFRSPPPLSISRRPFNYVRLSWIPDGSPLNLQFLAPPSTNWSTVYRLPYGDGQGGHYIEEEAPAPIIFYRLWRAPR